MIIANNNQKIANKLFFSFMFWLFGFIPFLANSNQLAPPSELLFKDKADVDLLSGTPVFSHSDLKIGHGELSLTHNYSSYAGYFASIWDIKRSYIDSANGGMDAQVRMGSSAYDFKLINGSWRPESQDGSTLTGNSEKGWLFTDRDGVKFYYGGGQNRQIIYPNGLTIEIGPDYVSTNNGLQLRYKYSPDSSGQGQILNEITAVNAAFAYCSLTENCTFSSEWPKVSYRWINKDAPVGQEFTFEVTDAEKVVTKYVHKRFKLTTSSATPARVIRVYENGNSVASREYNYYEYKQCSEGSFFGYLACNGSLLLVDNATVLGHFFDYFWQSSDGVYSSVEGRVQSLSGDASISSTSYKGSRPVYTNSFWRDGTANYDGTSLNRITSISNKGIKYSYEYDNRGNITRRTQKPTQPASGPAANDIIEEAGYPASCINQKTCNKPEWISDANGNITNFEYHAQSGQTSKITLPADSNGIRPVKHYKYEQRYARYLINNNYAIQTATTPIWLLTEEIHCISKAATSTSCQVGDSLSIKYEYGTEIGPNNLWMTGKVEVSPTGEERRTCFEYDKLGNKISEISPKANLTSCP